MALGVALEQLATRPLDGEKVQSGACLADFDRADDVGVGDPRTVLRLADESRDRGLVVAQLFAEHLDRAHAVLRMLGAEDGGRPAFADQITQGIPSERGPDQLLSRHAAKLGAA